jgi:ANTH domain
LELSAADWPDRVASYKCPRSKRSSKTPANQSLLLQNQRLAPRCCPPASLPQLSSNSTSTPSSQPHGLMTVPSMTSAELSLPVFGSQIPSSVRSSHLVSRRTSRRADTSSGGVQGAHRSPYHDSKRRNRQRASVFVFFGGFTIKECGRWSMGRYVLCALLYSLCWTEPAHTFISGYNAPTNLQHYALYLDTRIRSYRELKHDAIRVQSETNRDLRLSMSLEDDARQNRKFSPGESQGAGGSRRKTIMGRKLRVMTVEKGLLRETKVVQKLLDSLVECRVS